MLRRPQTTWLSSFSSLSFVSSVSSKRQTEIRNSEGDPARKLSPADRLIGSSLLALDEGITPVYIAVGAAGALYRYISESGSMEPSVKNAKAVLEEVSNLREVHPLTEWILDFYDMIVSGAAMKEICRAADQKKAETLGNVI